MRKAPDPGQGVADEVVSAGSPGAGVPQIAEPVEEVIERKMIRNEKGHFARGNSASRGISHRKQAKLAAELLEPHRAAILQRTLDVAFDQRNPQASVGALRILAERLLGAVPRPDDELAPVEGLAEAGGLQAKAEHVVNAAGRGEVSPAAARALLGALADAARISTRRRASGPHRAPGAGAEGENGGGAVMTMNPTTARRLEALEARFKPMEPMADADLAAAIDARLAPHLERGVTLEELADEEGPDAELARLMLEATGRADVARAGGGSVVT